MNTLQQKTIIERDETMKGIKTLVVLACLAAITIVATDASAYYHPTLGRFLSRDPGAGGAVRAGAARPSAGGGFIPRDPTGSNQYADGMNLYQYVGGNPVGLRDPSGLAVRIDCRLRKEVGSLMRQWAQGGRVHVVPGKGYDTWYGHKTYVAKYGPANAGPANHKATNTVALGDSDYRRILVALVNSPRVFVFKYDAKDKGVAKRALINHLIARRNVVVAAKTANFRWGDRPRMDNPDSNLWNKHWSWPLKGKEMAALRDMWSNGHKYPMACQLAAHMCLLRGVAETVGEEMFAKDFEALAEGQHGVGSLEQLIHRSGHFRYGVGSSFTDDDEDWIPGEMGVWHDKTDMRSIEGGQHVISLGGGTFYGHAGERERPWWQIWGSPRYGRTDFTVKELRKGGDSYAEPWREHPTEGLETVKPNLKKR